VRADWEALAAAVDRDGFGVSSSPVLAPAECAELRDGWDDPDRYRKTIDMGPLRFGEGRYRYFRYPLPEVVAELRAEAYPGLATLASQWAKHLGEDGGYPDDLDAFLRQCAAAGQTKPTPLVLRYEAGGYNCLHQDLYGDVAFPLQLTVALTEPGADHTGGHNVFVEQRPRAQSRAHVVEVPLGHAVVFPTRHRAVAGSRGHYRVTVRHGVGTVTSGVRFTLGVIFHDAA
jgi:hypothetical protein